MTLSVATLVWMSPLNVINILPSWFAIYGKKLYNVHKRAKERQIIYFNSFISSRTEKEVICHNNQN